MSGSTMIRGARATLHSVAAAAGVSKSTVSRVLDERLPHSDNETARRVRRIATELGYVRDVSASSLRRGTTMTVGVVVPRLTDTVMAMLFEALATACARNGLSAMVSTTGDKPDGARHSAESLLRRGVDGLILATASGGDDFPAELAARNIPFVLALRTDGINLSSVGDDVLGGYLAARHLLDLGHQRIGLIKGPETASSARGRVAGFMQAFAEADISFDPALGIDSTFDIDSGAIAAGRLAKLQQRPTAVFAVNDNTAIGAMSAFTAMGLSVPGDISLVGYNDIPIVSHLPTPLTTVRVPFDRIATIALELLEEAADLPVGERIRKSTPTLIPRKSTARL